MSGDTMKRLSIENKLRKLLQNCDTKPVLSPVVSIVGTTKEIHRENKDKHIGLNQAIEMEYLWKKRVFELQSLVVPGFKIPTITTQYIEEMDHDLIFTGVASGKFQPPGSMIMMIHGDECGNVTYGGLDEPGKWFSSKKLAECISTSGITLGRIILPICNGDLVNQALSDCENIIQIVGSLSGDILEENGGMTCVLKDETYDSYFEYLYNIHSKLLREIIQNKPVQLMGKSLVEA